SSVGSAPVTRTFAARDEVEVWTRRLSSAPDAPPPTADTPPASSGPSAEIAEAPGASLDDGGREPSGISSSKLSRSPKNKTGVALLIAGSVGFVGLAFAFAPSAKSSLVAAPVAVPARVASAQASAVPLEQPPPLDSGPDPRPEPSNPRLLAAHVAGAPHARSAAALDSAEPEQFGVLKLTADPRAVVEVSGPRFQRSAPSPLVGLKVPVGRYQVVFRNDALGAPLAAQVVVIAGASRSVHADFRLAEPAISVR
ncbi:MAG: hypothetical protein ABW061_06125, partial [Polyangiaceae bacterium]